LDALPLGSKNNLALIKIVLHSLPKILLQQNLQHHYYKMT